MFAADPSNCTDSALFLGIMEAVLEGKRFMGCIKEKGGEREKEKIERVHFLISFRN